MFLQLDFSSEIPIYLQIRNQIVLGIANGSLLSGDRLPTIRALADESGINMMTVSKAYQLLKSEGYIETDRRSGATVKGSSSHKKLGQRETDALHLIAAQARLDGYELSDFLELCKNIFEKGG